MKSTLNSFLPILFLALSIVGCTDDKPDNIKPVIELISPVDDQHFERGDLLGFHARLGDETGLMEMKVDIHVATGHDHKSLAFIEPWQWDTIIDLSGKNREMQFLIPVPEDVQDGFYHFIVFLTDTSGNEAMDAIVIEVGD